MECKDAIDGRRSIRKYVAGRTIPRADMERILESAMKAPSARNSRPWNFIVIEDRKTLEDIGKISENMSVIATASAAIAVCGDSEASEFWQQDCGAAIQNLLLGAYSMGYGTCWYGIYPVKNRMEVLDNIIGPVEGTLMALIAIGVADESPASRGGYDPSKVRFV